jgi:bifunctional UDP-N-acetylglucosamine pyrophosphorylase/glucosamine-1-phosphate N-acetyltransferase
METKPEYYFKKIKGFPVKEIFNTNSVIDILKKKDEFLSKLSTKVEGWIDSNSNWSGKIFVGKDTIIKHGVTIEGPVYIGKNCKIGPGAYIRKNTIIGDCCELGRIEIKGSVIMNNVKAHHHGYIGDSIIGDEVNIGAGVVLTNFKFGGKMIRWGDIEIGRKFGAVIGDESSIGCNTCTMPGTFLGPNVWVYPNCNVSGFVPKNMIIKHKQPHELVEKKE